MIKKGAYWRIGNGENIKIWHDGWLPHQNRHKIWTTQNILPEDTTISMLLDDEYLKWKHSIANEIFLPFEATQILSIPLPAFARQDKFIWGETNNGDFSIRSTCRLIKRLDAGKAEPSILDLS